MNATIGTLRIGTSNIVLPEPKKSYPLEFQSGSRLRYYSTLFNTLEVNSTFYKIPLATTFERWSTEVPDNFKFTIKLWRQITHVKKLLYKIYDIDFFMEAANSLGNKKGCLLIQFPPSITIQYFTEVEKIIERLYYKNIDEQWKLSIEFRHSSWYEPITYSMIEKYNASIVIHDIAASTPPNNITTNNTFYLRFHGPLGNYRGSYSEEILLGYSHHVKKWIQQGRDVYIYFNNTMSNNALGNAQLLQQLTL